MLAGAMVADLAGTRRSRPRWRVKMAEQDSEKQGQAGDMNSRQTAETVPPAAPSVPGAMLEADLQAHIGRQLRAVYEEVVNEEVPDRFLRLLRELEQKEGKQA